jgi:integrase
MPRLSSGPRLYLKAARRRPDGSRERAVWEIRDAAHRESTGCGADDVDGAARALEQYLNRKHQTIARSSERAPAQIPVADVLSLYAEHVAPRTARPRETLQAIMRLLDFFGDKVLSEITGLLCRAFVRKRETDSGARVDLSILRAAINFHRKEGFCNAIVSVTLPPQVEARDRWITRNEAAQLIWHAWRYREVQKGQATGRRTRQHVARFILVALYTGTRAGAVCSAAFERVTGAGFVDLERGIF